MDPLLSIGDVALIFGISRSTAFRLKKAQSWPHVRFGTEIRFTPEDVQAIIALNHKAPPPPRTVPNVGTRANRRNGKQ